MNRFFIVVFLAFPVLVLFFDRCVASVFAEHAEKSVIAKSWGEYLACVDTSEYKLRMRKHIDRCKKGEVDSELCSMLNSYIQQCGNIIGDPGGPTKGVGNGDGDGDGNNFYFVKLFFETGNAKPNYLIMYPYLIDTFNEFIESLAIQAGRITIIGHADLQAVNGRNVDYQKLEYYGDKLIDQPCKRASLHPYSNACLAYMRSVVIWGALQYYLQTEHQQLDSSVVIDPPCYSRDPWLRHANKMLSGELWEDLAIEKKIKAVFKILREQSDNKISLKKLLLRGEVIDWSVPPEKKALADFRDNDDFLEDGFSDASRAQLRKQLSVFRSVVIILWLHNDLNINSLIECPSLKYKTFIK